MSHKTLCNLGNREKRLSNVTNTIFLGETRKLKGELPKIIPKPKILKENERTLTKKKLSDIVPKNVLKEQPGKEMRIREKETVVQFKECIKILERYKIVEVQQISLWLALFVGREHDVSTCHLHVIGGITSSFIGLARVERCRHSTNL